MEPWQPGQAVFTFRKILVLPICQSSCGPSTASAMRWHVPRRSPWAEGKDIDSIWKGPLEGEILDTALSLPTLHLLDAGPHH